MPTGVGVVKGKGVDMQVKVDIQRERCIQQSGAIVECSGHCYCCICQSSRQPIRTKRASPEPRSGFAPAATSASKPEITSANITTSPLQFQNRGDYHDLLRLSSHRSCTISVLRALFIVSFFAYASITLTERATPPFGRSRTTPYTIPGIEIAPLLLETSPGLDCRDSQHSIAMPGPKSLPPRSSQRRNTNQQDEEPPPRTRSGRGPKSAAKDTKPEIVSPKANSHQTSTTPLKRKTTRQASTVTNYANLEAGNVVYGLWEAPIFHVFGIPREFLDGLKETKTSRKRRFSERSDLPALDTLSNEPDSMSEDESDDPPSPEDSAPSRGRGRGGRGSRGGRARGRGRGNRGGRGGRPAKPSAAPSTTSPSRTRPSRNAAPAFPLVEEDDDEPSNQESAADDAKLSSEVESENMDDYSEDDFEPSQTNGKQANHVDDEDMPDVASFPKTPAGSPPEELVQAYQDPDAKIPVPPPVPKISLPQKAVSRTRTPKEGTSTPVPPAPKLPMLAPEDDALSDSDFVGPWIEGAPDPIEAECEDRADYLLQKKYKPMVDVQDVISSLTKYAFAQRSTESLYALAENTQKILQAWQDEYLRLDARVSNTIVYILINANRVRLLRMHIHQRNLVMGVVFP